MDISNEINRIMGIDLGLIFDFITGGLISYSPKIIGAILTLWIGFKITSLVLKGIINVMEKKNFSPMLKGFLISLLDILFKIMVIIAAAGILGVQTSSFVAMLAAAGFAIGMALSGTLQNFAGGIMILLLKPFRIGHYVEIGGYAGSIKEIGIFNTTIITPDKKRIIIPNSDISNGSMINYSAEPKRRLDFVIGVSYSDDIDKVKETLLEITTMDERILQDEEITIGLTELAESSVNFNFRFFVKKEDYWSVKYDTLENIKKTFDKKGISFPFPQRDMHIFEHKIK